MKHIQVFLLEKKIIFVSAEEMMLWSVPVLGNQHQRTESFNVTITTSFSNQNPYVWRVADI